jgi:hypothetical protein
MLSELENAAQLRQLVSASNMNTKLVLFHMLKAQNARERVKRAANKAAVLAQKMGSLMAAKSAAAVRAREVKTRKYLEGKVRRFFNVTNVPNTRMQYVQGKTRRFAFN